MKQAKRMQRIRGVQNRKRLVDVFITWCVHMVARDAGKALIAEGKSAGPDRKTFIYVNNRLEGNALETIDAMLDAAAS